MRFALSATAVTVELMFASGMDDEAECTPQSVGSDNTWTPTSVVICRGLVQTMLRGRPAQCAKCVAPSFGDDSGVAEDQLS